MATPAKPPLAPNPGIASLLDLLKSEKVNPNEVFVAAWKELATLLENEKEGVRRVIIATKCIAVYIAAVKAIPEIMHEHVNVPSGAFVSTQKARPKDSGGVLADKRNSGATRLPKPGSFTE